MDNPSDKQQKILAKDTIFGKTYRIGNEIYLRINNKQAKKSEACNFIQVARINKDGSCVEARFDTWFFSPQLECIEWNNA